MLKKILRIPVLFCLIVGMMFGAAACTRGGGTDIGDGPIGSNDPDAVELQVAYQQDSSEARIITALASGFVKEQQAKGVSVRINPVAVPAAEYNQSILKMYNGENLPDVVYTYDDYASQWAENGVFENLDPYFEKDSFDFSKYDENAFEPARVYNGSLYYAPREYNQPVVYLNTSLLEQYGIDYEQYKDGWTWDEMVALLRTIRTKMDAQTNRDYIYPLDSSFEWAAMLNAFVLSEGGYLFDAETRKAGFEEAGTQAAMGEIMQLIEDKLIADPRSTVSGGAFLNGNAAMWITSRPRVSSCIESEIELAFLPMPLMGENEHYLCYGNTGYAISSISDKKDLAWEFCKYVMSESGQEVFSATGNCVPILLSMQQDENATWRKYLEGVDQSAFIRSDSDEYTYVLATYARGYDPSKERGIYNKVSQLIGELSNSSGAAAFCTYAQAQVEGVM